MNVPALYVILALVAVQRLAETIYARRNTRALLASGAVEIAPAQYPFFVALHSAWLLSMLVLVPASAPVDWWLVAIYGLLQGVRFWILATLKGRWTTRIVVLPDAPLVRSGPYRFMRHPNYALVVAEIAVLPLAFDAYAIAATFTVLNLVLLWWRIRTESAALAALSG
ncbi:MAG: isoprenylcysteine carboxyl methyltransferase family protein [Candidatus Tyrphobacter sp.]